MMKKKITIYFGAFCIIIKGQVGINTNHPVSILHVDAKKDNVVSPNAVQASDDFTVSTTDGNVMVGGIAPTSKLEINGELTNTSGLKFRNLTGNSIPISSISQTYLGVDENGNVIVAGNDFSRTVKTIQNNITNYNNVVKNNDGSSNTFLQSFTFQKNNGDAVPFLPNTIMPGSDVSFTIPSGRPRAVFMNFMMGFELTRTTGSSGNANGSEVFGAELLIINTATNVTAVTGVSQFTQVPSVLPTRQTYSINYINNLPAGNYIARIRINTRLFLFSNGTAATVKGIIFKPIQYSYNISYFET